MPPCLLCPFSASPSLILWTELCHTLTEGKFVNGYYSIYSTFVTQLWEALSSLLVHLIDLVPASHCQLPLVYMQYMGITCWP